MKYKKAKLLSLLLAGTFILSNTLSTYAYNGGSGTGGGSTSSSGSGNNGKPLITGFDIKNQFFSYSLYYMPMNADELGREPEKVEARNKKWTEQATSAKQIGSEVLVSRDGFKKAGTNKQDGAIATYDGDICSAFGKGIPYDKALFSNGEIPFVNAKEIGLTGGDEYPVYMSSLNGEKIPAGKSTVDYFMSKRANYDPNTESPYEPKDNMKNLIRYIAGVDSNGVARVSFKDDPEELTVAGITYKKNHNNILDLGLYNGKSCEYKLFIEAGVVANGIAYTGRELVTADVANGGKDALVYNLANNFLKNMVNKVYLTEDDAFNLKKATRFDYSSGKEFRELLDFALRDQYLIKGNIGNVVNILSSELFTPPVQRTIGTHTNIFLDTGDAVSLEYVGMGTEISLNEQEQFRDLIKSDTLDNWYIDNVNNAGLGGLNTQYSLDFVRGYVQDGLVKAGYKNAGNTNAGTQMQYASIRQLTNNKEFESDNTTLGVNLDVLNRGRSQGVILLDKDEHNQLKNTEETNGNLNEDAKTVLSNNAYINPDNDYKDTLRSYDAKGLKFVPVAAGGTVMKVYQDNGKDINTTTLSKGVLKDVIDETLDVVGGKLVDDYTDASGNTGRSASGTVSDIITEVLGSTPSGRSGVVYSQDNDLVNTTLLENSSYGKTLDGKVVDKSVNTYKINTIIESTLSLSGTHGTNTLSPDVYEGVDWAKDKTKTISKWVDPSTTIEPYRFYGGETNDEIKNKVISEIDKAKDAEVQNVIDKGVDKFYDSASIAVRNDIDADKQSEYIQMASQVALNSVLPKTLSEISESSYYKHNILGNYGSSYIVWDVGIPIDIIVMTKDSSGKLKVIDGVQDGKDGYAILTDQWYVPSGTERILSIPDKIKLKLSTGDLVFKPTEAVMKPASVSLDEFIKEYEPVLGKDGAVLDFGDNLQSVVRQDPFSYKPNDDSRATATMSANSMAGGVTHYINNGTGELKGAMSIVASEDDKESYIANPTENRMALVLTVEMNDSSSVTQYNIIETKRNGKLVGTEIIKTTPKYDSNGDVILESSIDNAKQQEWVTSDKDEPPTKWEDVENKVPPSNSSDKPSEKIPTIDKDGDGENNSLVIQ